MRRREFIALVGAAATWPLGAHAQQTGKLPTIGFLGTDAALLSPRTGAFAKRLGELGWAEGRTVSIEYRWSEGRPERYAEIAAEFVRLGVDVIVANGTAVPALKQATSVIPIVFAVATDPIGTDLVASLARPGGNVTGLSNQQSDLVGKRLALAREIVPHLRRLAILANPGFSEAVREMSDVQRAARTLGLEVVPIEIRDARDIAPALATVKSEADALYIVQEALVTANRTQIVKLTLGARLPTIFSSSEFVQAGGLMSYGTNFSDLYERAAELVDKILRGARPGDVPVEQPTKFELVINLTTAKTLGLAIPGPILSLADQLIE